MDKIFNVTNVSIIHDQLNIKIDSQEYSFNLKDISEKLYQAGETQRNNFNVSPSGYGIHWPGIDEDLSINCLLNFQKNRHVA